MVSSLRCCFTLLIGLTLYITSAGAVSAGDRDIFIFIGQSNMAGRTPFLSSDYSVATNADLLTTTGAWTPASNLSSPDSAYSLPANYFGYNRYSNVEKSDKPQLYNPGRAFASAMAQLRPGGNRLGLIFNARGATTVADWQMTAAPLDPTWGPDNLFHRTLDRVGGAEGPGPNSNEVKGLIIDIGASDALYGTSPTAYLSGLATLVADFRTQLGLPNLPVFVGQQPFLRPEDYADYTNPNAARDGYRLNAALSQWAAADPLVHVIRSGGAGLLSHLRPDSSHFDHTGMDLMGAGYARAVAEHVYGQVPSHATLSAANFSPDQTCSDGVVRPQCTLELSIKTPNWTLAQDVIVLPHRGYWGFGNVISVPENSIEGYEIVPAEGYGMSEVDFTPTATLNPRASTPGIPIAVMSHDYILYRETTYPRNTNPNATDPLFSDFTISDLAASRLQLRDRVGDATQEYLVFQTDSIPALVDLNLLTVGDLKQLSSPDPNQFAINWVKQLASIMYDYDELGALYTLSIKTAFTPSFIIDNLPPDLETKFDQVLWIPQVATNATYMAGAPGMGDDIWIASSTDYMDVWQNNWPSILYFEINYRSTSDSRLQPFSLNGYNYVNLLDYAKSTTNYRGGVFSEEPISPLGNVNRNGLWAIKNADTDTRGDPLFEAFRPTWGKFIVATTDRPDVWEVMLCQFYADC